MKAQNNHIESRVQIINNRIGHLLTKLKDEIIVETYDDTL